MGFGKNGVIALVIGSILAIIAGPVMVYVPKGVEICFGVVILSGTYALTALYFNSWKLFWAKSNKKL